MVDVVLRTATRLLMPLMFAFSLFLLVRGHSEPGGGFSAGLVSAAALGLYSIAYDVSAARRALRIDPRRLIGAGLAVAASSGVIALLRGEPFLAGQWANVTLPWITLDLGTPLLFDVGVYLVVMGASLTIIFALEEEQ